MFKSDFDKSIFRMFTGNVTGTIITFATLPILTRLYSQEDFGNFQMLISVVALFASISALRYEMAIVLPENELEAKKVISVSLLILIIYTTFLSILFTVLGDKLFRLLDIGNIEGSVILIIIAVFITGLYQISVNIIVRLKEFKHLSKNGITRPVISNIGGVIAGLINPTFAGLYFTQILSQLVITLSNIRKSNFSVHKLPIRNLKNTLIKYRKFPFINSPLEFINTYSVQLPVLLLNIYFGPGAVGIYMVADRLLNTPLRVVGQSFQKVYYKEAADAYKKGSKELLITYKSTIKKLAIIGFFPLIIVFLFAPYGVQLVLGDDWSDAGIYMQILMVGYYFRFINSPISATFSVIDKQEVGLTIVIVSLVLRWGSMVLFSQSIYTMLIALTVSTSLFYIIYNFFIYYFIVKDNK
jgi:lipopolysaccharide exporter